MPRRQSWISAEEAAELLGEGVCARELADQLLVESRIEGGRTLYSEPSIKSLARVFNPSPRATRVDRQTTPQTESRPHDNRNSI
jgi:hypothetical protein